MTLNSPRFAQSLITAIDNLMAAAKHGIPDGELAVISTLMRLRNRYRERIAFVRVERGDYSHLQKVLDKIDQAIQGLSGYTRDQLAQ